MSKVLIQVLLLLLAACTNVASAVNVHHIKRGRRLVLKKRHALTAASPYSTKAPSLGKGTGKGSTKSPSYSTKSPSKSTKMPKSSPKKGSKKSGKGDASSTNILAAAQVNSSMAETMTVGVLSVVLASAFLWM